MDIEQVMNEKNFVVVGDTTNPEKYAYKIKHALLEKQYHVECVGKELNSLNEVEGQIDIIDLCIHPKKGLPLLKECNKPFKMIVIQPGAADAELLAYLDAKQLPYLEGCVLVGLSLYRENK